MSEARWGSLGPADARALLRAWPAPVFLVDAAGMIVAASGEAGELVGASPEQLEGAELGALFPAFEAASAWERWFAELAHVPLDSLHGVRHPGGVRAAEVKARRCGDRVLLVMRDVTDERAMNYQTARRISEATRLSGFLTDVLRHFPLVVYVVDGDGRIRLAEGLGLSRIEAGLAERLLGAPVEDLVGREPSALAGLARASADDGGEVGGGAFRSLFRGRFFEHFTKPIPLEDGRRGLVGVGVDATEAVLATQESERVRAALEAELRAANVDLAHALKLRDEFLAATSHELRTPLHSILGLVESVIEGAFGDVSPGLGRPLRATLESARQLLATINGILDLTKLEAGKAELRRELVAGGRIAVDVVELSRAKAERAQIALTLVVEEEGAVEIDRKRITRALFELVDNAIKYTPPGGHVRVRARAEESAFVYEVEDDGVGVEEQDRRRIFQPFVQADGGLARERNGLGLGLALVERVIALHDGGVAFESARGAGSQVRVRLPRVASVYPAETTPSLRARSSESAVAGLRVVLVGGPRALDPHRDLLELRGAEADVLAVPDAIARLEVAPIDVLVVGPDVHREDLARVVLTVRTHGYGARVAVLVFGERPEAGDHEGWTSAGVEAWLAPGTDARTVLHVVAREHRRRAVLSFPPPESAREPKA
jgi:signal transduction histidine kinase